MKKIKEIQLFQSELQSNIQNMELMVNQYIKKIKKEYSQNIIKEKNKLLLKIAEGENIDINSLKSKYLKSKELIFDENTENTNIEIEQLLEKIIIDDKIYYYENKEKGKVFDDKTIEVGTYKNSSFIFN